MVLEKEEEQKLLRSNSLVTCGRWALIARRRSVGLKEIDLIKIDVEADSWLC
jgi:hypothetical protein